MDTPHTIEVTITETGEVKAVVQGVAGPVCGPLAAFLDALGPVVEDGPMPDFYAAVEAEDRVTLGYGGRP